MLSLQEIQCTMDSIEELALRLKHEHKELYKMLSVCDKRKEDYLHLLELADLPANKVAMITADFRNLLRERRDIKNRIEVIEKIMNKSVVTTPINKIDVKKAMTKKKTYKVRFDHNLFNTYKEYITRSKIV